MSPALSVAIYFTMWWIVLFAVLPWGVRNASEAGDTPVPGVDPGAPVKPHLLLKALATTVVSGVLFAALYVYVAYVS